MTSIFFVSALIIIGLILLAIEFLLVPGFSVPGIAGIAMIVYGIYQSAVLYGFSGAVITAVSSVVLSLLLVRIALRSQTIKAVSLDYTQTGTSAIDNYSSLLGKTGTALSDLRPSGLALIDNKRWDVVADGEFITKGSAITVSQIDGTRIVITLSEKEI